MATLQQRLQFMQSQAAHVESRVRMIRHGSIQYHGLVGISREANPHADSILYYSYDGTAEMGDLANRANDYPLVNVQEDQHTVPIHWKGIAYDWSDREIGRAMLLGVPLQDRKVRVAFRRAEEEKEKVWLNGDTQKGWDSMLAHTGVPIQAAVDEWEGATDHQIFEQLNTLIGGAWEATNQSRMCDTLLLPVQKAITLGRPMGNDANRSIMRYFMENNILYTTTGREPMVRTVRQLKGAGAGGVDRAIAYPRDMEVLRLHIPQELTFIEPQREAARWVYYGHLVLAGLEIMEPNAMRYLDGI